MLPACRFESCCPHQFQEIIRNREKQDLSRALFSIISYFRYTGTRQTTHSKLFCGKLCNSPKKLSNCALYIYIQWYNSCNNVAKTVQIYQNIVKLVIRCYKNNNNRPLLLCTYPFLKRGLFFFFKI